MGLFKFSCSLFEQAVMIDVKAKVFVGATVKVDEYRFHLCTFTDCTFRWNGKPYAFDQCDIRGFRGISTGNERIAHTIGLLQALGLLEEQFARSWGTAQRIFMPPPTIVIDASEKKSGVHLCRERRTGDFGTYPK